MSNAFDPSPPKLKLLASPNPVVSPNPPVFPSSSLLFFVSSTLLGTSSFVSAIDVESPSRAFLNVSTNSSAIFLFRNWTENVHIFPSSSSEKSTPMNMRDFSECTVGSFSAPVRGRLSRTLYVFSWRCRSRTLFVVLSRKILSCPFPRLTQRFVRSSSPYTSLGTNLETLDRASNRMSSFSSPVLTTWEVVRRGSTGSNVSLLESTKSSSASSSSPSRCVSFFGVDSSVSWFVNDQEDVFAAVSNAFDASPPNAFDESPPKAFDASPPNVFNESPPKVFEPSPPKAFDESPPKLNPLDSPNPMWLPLSTSSFDFCVVSSDLSSASM